MTQPRQKASFPRRVWQWFKRHPLRLKLLLGGYWLAMFTGTHVPPIHTGVSKNHRDKLMHFGAYFGLAILLAAVRSLRGRMGQLQYLTTLLILSGYGVIDEFLQQFVSRDPDPLDWLADTVGAAVGLAVWALLSRQLQLTAGDQEPAVVAAVGRADSGK